MFLDFTVFFTTPFSSGLDSQAKKKKKFDHSNGNVHSKLRARHSSSPPAVSRKESFTAEGVVTNIDDYEDDSRLPSQKVTNEGKESRGKFLSNWKRKKPYQQTRSHDLLSSSSDQRGCQTLPHLTVYSTEDERGRRSTSLPPSAQTGLQELRQQFESLSSSSPTPPVTPKDTDVSHVTSGKHFCLHRVLECMCVCCVPFLFVSWYLFVTCAVHLQVLCAYPTSHTQILIFNYNFMTL